MENYKLYIDTDKENIKIKFSINYLKPSESHNWATGEFRETGYRVIGVPVEVSGGNGAYQMESYTAFTGFGDTLLPCNRRSQKRYDEAKRILDQRMLRYLKWFQDKGYVITEEALSNYQETV